MRLGRWPFYITGFIRALRSDTRFFPREFSGMSIFYKTRATLLPIFAVRTLKIPVRMRTILSLFLFFASLLYTHAIAQGDCDIPLAQKDLAPNNVRARITTGGGLWFDGSVGRYVAPKVPPGQIEVSAIFAGGLWIGGLDESGNLKLAAQTYGRASGASDYFPGPIAAGENPPTNSSTCWDWDQFFEINQDLIAQHIADFEDNGVIDGPVPEEISGWPARGNESFSSVHFFDLPDADLAPFFDRNENGLYEAELGDYPIALGEQSEWWVFNDAGNVHTDSEGDILNMEVHANAFSFSSDTAAYLDNTTFYEFDLIYKGDEPIQSTYVGLWTDPDLGCFTDDYVGCNPGERMSYVYNGEEEDTTPCPTGVSSYGEEVPVLAIKVLRALQAEDGSEAPFAAFTYYLKSSSIPPGTVAQTDPDSPEEYYNYLSGKWKDGTPFSQGGNAYDPDAPAYPFAFDGSEVDGVPWTECSANTEPEDRRMLMSFGPLTLMPGEVRKFAFAVVWKADQEYPCPDLSLITEDAKAVEAFYFEQYGEEVPTAISAPATRHQVRVSPNPMSHHTIIELEGSDAKIRSAQLFTLQGQLLRQYHSVNQAALRIDRASLSSGLYLYRLQTDNGEMLAGKLLVH